MRLLHETIKKSPFALKFGKVAYFMKQNQICYTININFVVEVLWRLLIPLYISRNKLFGTYGIFFNHGESSFHSEVDLQLKS